MQAFDVITWFARAAVLVILPGTHFTAAAAVQHGADARRARGGRGRARALLRATAVHLGAEEKGGADNVSYGICLFIHSILLFFNFLFIVLYCFKKNVFSIFT